MLTLPGKQIKLVSYPHKDASLHMKKVPPNESTNITLKSLKCIVLRCFFITYYSF